MPLLPASGGSASWTVVNSEGNSPSEIHDVPVCSTLYNTPCNMPATSPEYHNEARQMTKMQPDPWLVRNLHE